VRIDLRNLKREPLFTATVDNKDPASVVKPPEPSGAGAEGGSGQEVYLNWDGALDDRGHLRRCPVCGCRELFTRKDFPQVTGFVIVVAAAVIAMVLFVGFRQVLAGVAILAAVAIVDLLIYFFTGRLLVCYRCRSEFRDVPIGSEQRGWDLATGEKYRDMSVEEAPAPPPPQERAP
jgi:hypothetical protein